MTTTRIYLVSNGESIERLVRAANRAQAIRHVTKPMFQSRVATQDDLISSIANGVEVETANEESDDE